MPYAAPGDTFKLSQLMMGDNPHLIAIIVFGALAAFRLWNVLGRRHGEERQRPSALSREEGAGPTAESEPVAERGLGSAEDESVFSGGPYHAADVGLDTVLTQLRIVDPDFESARFLDGAKGAFRMIVEAYAAGDTETLEPLLSPELMATFRREIGRRAQKGRHLETAIRSIESAEIVDASLAGAAAHISVKFVSTQTALVKDADGAVLEGDPESAETVTDIWTFSRNIRWKDPNWELVETRTED